MMVTNRSASASGPGSNQSYGVDGSFSFFQNLIAGAYWARTATTGVRGDDQSYQGRVDYNADRYGARAEVLSVGLNFRPEVGFTRRTNLTRSFGELRFSPRPTRIKSVRKFTWSGSGDYIVNGSGAVDSRLWIGRFGTEFHNSDQISIDVTRDYERLVQPFTPAGSPSAIAPGSYTFGDVSAAYTLGAQRRVSGTIAARSGRYYDGTIRSLSFGVAGMSQGRVSIVPQLSVEPGVSLTRIELPGGAFTTKLVRARTDFAFTPLMFVSALVQYNSADRALSSNLRFRWEYLPGSELLVVYTDEYDRTDERFATPTLVRGLKNRAFVVKATRLLRF
jgi:hypothetical protein